MAIGVYKGALSMDEGMPVMYMLANIVLRHMVVSEGLGLDSDPTAFLSPPDQHNFTPYPGLRKLSWNPHIHVAYFSLILSNNLNPFKGPYSFEPSL